MTLARWLRSALAPRPAARTRPPALRLSVERLEDRLTPSTGGLLDPTFGSGGHLLSSFTNNYDQANAVAVQPDGKVVIAGQGESSGSKTYFDFLVARYNADGSVDSSFGSGGSTLTDFSRGYDYAEAVALQPQASGPAKILAAGMAQVNGKDDFALARYTPTGALDTTFGSKGKVTTDLGGAGDWAYSMAVDGAGRILVAGNGNGNFAVVRYTPNGALDTTFGSGGKVITSIRVANNGGHGLAVALQPDGKIVLAGTTIDPATSTPEFVVARFNANGTADSGFGTGGVATTLVGGGEHFGGLAIQGDGKIVIDGSESTGSSPPALYLLRYNADGTLDANFGVGGVAAVPSPGGPGAGAIDAHGSGVAVQADGKIVAGGQFYATTAQQENLAAVRVNPDGSVDTDYSNGGWATVQFGSNDSLQAIGLQPDGRLLLAGYAKPTSTGPTDVALVRFLGAAPEVGSFTASSNPVPSGSSTTLTASHISDGNPGATIKQVTFYYLDGTGTEQVLGYGTADGLGDWTLSFTVGLAPGSYTLYAQAQDSYGALGDPLALALQVL